MRQVGYTLEWQLVERGNDTLCVHGGGFTGFATLISFLPRQRLGVAVMANESSLGGALTDVVTAGMENGRAVQLTWDGNAFVRR